MSDGSVRGDLRRAELARVQLARDLSTVVQTGDRLIERGKSFLRKAVPVAIAVGLLGLMLAASVAARSRPRSLFKQKPSFVGELLRRAALAAAGTLASRLVRRLPLPPPRSSGSPELPGALFDPMLPEFKAGRGPGRRRARA